ncbi:hypothetical protein RB195_022157 [Necator americanus]|uniref:Uncharacterized protein n=1 Tax=Necator americanus TaxID=51031 RepID=A0ABR1EE65_NECAM
MQPSSAKNERNLLQIAFVMLMGRKGYSIWESSHLMIETVSPGRSTKGKPRQEISSPLKWMIFLANFLVFLSGVSVFALGVYLFIKDLSDVKFVDIVLNPAILLGVLAGAKLSDVYCNCISVCARSGAVELADRGVTLSDRCSPVAAGQSPTAPLLYLTVDDS